MKILCAPDSFKGTISAADAAEAMAKGAAAADPSITGLSLPVADGGEGTMDALMWRKEGEIRHAEVLGPLGEAVDARFGLIPDGPTGVIELAAASGLVLVPEARRDATAATTFGTGQLIAAARAAGCETVLVGIGGSATCDGGTGLAQALGGRFYDDRDRLIEEPLTGGRLAEIRRFEPPASLPEIHVACDVTNPLCGENGAAAVYGPQKGATPAQVDLLDRNLAHLATIVGGDPDTPGFGASGGAGFGLVMMCRATLHRGIDLVLESIGFAQQCRGASLVLTGEGRLDGQSLHGKACMGVAAAAKKLGVPTIAIVGSTGPNAKHCTNQAAGGSLASYVSLDDRYGRERAMRETAPLLAETAADVARSFRAR